MKEAVLYVVMSGEEIVQKSGSSNRGPAIYVLRRNAEKELKFQQTYSWRGTKLLNGDAKVVEFIARPES